MSYFFGKILQRVVFFWENFTTCFILHEKKKLKRQIWKAFLFLKRLVFTHFTP